MDLFTILLVMVRRWILVIPILIVTVALCAVTLQRSKPTYQSSGSLLVGDSAINVAASLGASQVSQLPVTLAATLLADQLQDAGYRNLVRAKGGTAAYVSRLPETGSGTGAVVYVDATSTNPAEIAATIGAVLDGSATALSSIQDSLGVPAAQRVTLKNLSVPAAAQFRATPGGLTGTGTVVLLPAALAGDPFSGSTYSTRILEARAKSAEMHQEVVNLGGTASYTVARTIRDEAPVLDITTQSPSPAAALKTFGAVVSALRQSLSKLEDGAGVPASSRGDLVALSTPAGAGKTPGSVIRPIVAIIVLGCAVAAALAVSVETFVNARRRRRNAALAQLWSARGRPIEPPPEPAAAYLGNGSGSLPLGVTKELGATKTKARTRTSQEATEVIDDPSERQGSPSFLPPAPRTSSTPPPDH
jgi:hypothetical protein